MTEAEIKSYVQAMLGGNTVTLELEDDDLHEIIEQSLARLRPYYSGKRYVQAVGKKIDLSAHDPITVTNVFQTSSNQILSMQDLVMGGPGIIIYDTAFKDRFITYLSYKMMLQEYKYQIQPSFRYIKPYLYLDNYQETVLIELEVKLKTPTDVEQTSMWYGWYKDYCLALAKQVIGRKRSKYIVQGSPYTLDGNVLIAEGLQEKQTLEEKLIGDFFVI